jgi:alkanesulfonate monooxygenase
MPVEINGLLNHNLSCETAPVPFGHFDLDAIRQQAILHDAGGYDRVLLANAATMPDNISIAAYVFGITQRLGVMLAHRPGFIAPTLAARALATLDRISDGRLAVHIISAANDVETQADGDFLTKERRYQRSREYIEILRAIWAAGGPIDHEGEFYRFKGGFAEIKPVQRPAIPIYFGGLSADAIAVGAAQADLFATLGDTVTGMREVIEKVRAAAAPHGRNPRFLMSIRIVLGATEEEAWAAAAALREQIAARMPPTASTGGSASAPAKPAAVPAAEGFRRQLEIAARGDRLEKRFWNGINQLRGGQSNSGALVGTAPQVVDALLDYYDAGVTAFILRGFDPIADTRRIGAELIPLLRAAVAERDAARAAAQDVSGSTTH